MKRVLTWIAIAVGVVLLPVVIMAVWGALLPRDHVATVTTDLAAPPERVFEVITDWQGQTRWREGVTKVDLLDPVNGHARIREESGFGPMTIEIVETASPSRVVTRIVDDSSFGGTWTYEITPTATGSRLAITEAGWVANPIFRFLSKYAFGHDGTIKKYQTSLARHLRA